MKETPCPHCGQDLLLPADINAELLAKLQTRLAAADKLAVVAKSLTINLPESEIDLAGEVWGWTNTNLIRNLRNELAAALDEWNKAQ